MDFRIFKNSGQAFCRFSLSCYFPNDSVINRWKECIFWMKNTEYLLNHIKDACMCAQSVQSCPTLCTPIDCSQPGPSAHGIFQAITVKWVAMPSSRGSSKPRGRTQVSCTAGRFITTSTTWEAPYQGWSGMLVTQSCLTVCSPMDCSSPGFSVHGILQARILEWVVIPSPGDLPDPGIEPRSPALQADSLPSEPLKGKVKSLSRVQLFATP